jgi:hypothetical protein
MSGWETIAESLELCAVMTGCCELANEHNALSAVCAIPLEGFAIATHEHTALVNEHNALIAIDTALILGY